MIEVVSMKKHIKLEFTNECVNGHYRVYFNKSEAENFAELLKEHLNNLGHSVEIEAQSKAYSEEFSVYKNKVERTLSISNYTTKNSSLMGLYLTCYTDKDDDNWIELTPRKISQLISHIYGYINNMAW